MDQGLERDPGIPQDLTKILCGIRAIIGYGIWLLPRKRDSPKFWHECGILGKKTRAVARKKLQPRRTHGPLYEISRMKSSNIISLIKKKWQYLVKFYRGESLGSPHTGYGPENDIRDSDDITQFWMRDSHQKKKRECGIRNPPFPTSKDYSFCRAFGKRKCKM